MTATLFWHCKVKMFYQQKRNSVQAFSWVNNMLRNKWLSQVRLKHLKNIWQLLYRSACAVVEKWFTNPGKKKICIKVQRKMKKRHEIGAKTRWALLVFLQTLYNCTVSASIFLWSLVPNKGFDDGFFFQFNITKLEYPKFFIHLQHKTSRVANSQSTCQ